MLTFSAGISLAVNHALWGSGDVQGPVAQGPNMPRAKPGLLGPPRKQSCKEAQDATLVILDRMPGICIWRCYLCVLLCGNIHVYTYIYIYICTYMHVEILYNSTNTHIDAYIYIAMYVYIYIYTYLSICIYVFTYPPPPEENKQRHTKLHLSGFWASRLRRHISSES